MTQKKRGMIPHTTPSMEGGGAAAEHTTWQHYLSTELLRAVGRGGDWSQMDHAQGVGLADVQWSG